MTPAGFPHSDTPGSQLGCQLPRAYRRLQRPSSALDAKASTMCPSQLAKQTLNKNNNTTTHNKNPHQQTAGHPRASSGTIINTAKTHTTKTNTHTKTTPNKQGLLCGRCSRPLSKNQETRDQPASTPSHPGGPAPDSSGPNSVPRTYAFPVTAPGSTPPARASSNRRQY